MNDLKPMNDLNVPQLVDLQPGRLTEFGRWRLQNPPMAGGASKSDYWEQAILDAAFGDPDVTITAPVYLALCTTVPTDASTGTTIVEANFTGYARKSVAAADMSAATGPSPGTKTNTSAITFAACTAGSSTVIGWALCDAATVGNITYWGTATSTVISTTQTPPTIGIGGLVCTED